MCARQRDSIRPREYDLNTNCHLRLAPMNKCQLLAPMVRFRIKGCDSRFYWSVPRRSFALNCSFSNCMLSIATLVQPGLLPHKCDYIESWFQWWPNKIRYCPFDPSDRCLWRRICLLLTALLRNSHRWIPMSDDDILRQLRFHPVHFKTIFRSVYYSVNAKVKYISEVTDYSTIFWVYKSLSKSKWISKN